MRYRWKSVRHRPITVIIAGVVGAISGIHSGPTLWGTFTEASGTEVYRAYVDVADPSVPTDYGTGDGLPSEMRSDTGTGTNDGTETGTLPTYPTFSPSPMTPTNSVEGVHRTVNLIPDVSETRGMTPATPVTLREPVPESGVEGDPVTLPTFGGSGTWSDCRILHEWRIQRHITSGECRLLDGRNFRLVQGTREQCDRYLDQLVQERKIPPMKGQAVILLHGLATTRYHMAMLGNYLEQRGGYTIVNVSYATTRADIDRHATNVAEVIEGLPDVSRIHFVAHSMGNIVLRRYFAQEIQRTSGHPDPRFGRCVMIGPPNHGAQAARMLHDNPLFGKTFGAGAEQLGAGWSDVEKTLTSPPIPFAVIAGGAGNSFGFNLLLPGDDDGVVRLEEAHLDGESAFRRLPLLHSLLPQSTEVHRLTLKFLETGTF
ncbi:MAG: hypothetical protein Q4C47_08045 [Planctomycetia bacterium]|nr:hypothetical protein [Planctomycetia bacterium]